MLGARTVSCAWHCHGAWPGLRLCGDRLEVCLGSCVCVKHAQLHNCDNQTAAQQQETNMNLNDSVLIAWCHARWRKVDLNVKEACINQFSQASQVGKHKYKRLRLVQGQQHDSPTQRQAGPDTKCSLSITTTLLGTPTESVERHLHGQKRMKNQLHMGLVKGKATNVTTSNPMKLNERQLNGFKPKQNLQCICLLLT